MDTENKEHLAWQDVWGLRRSENVTYNPASHTNWDRRAMVTTFTP
jgi:hypothetical protein